jgi:hypothetical protein
MRKAAVMGIALAWLVLVAATHYGGRSPYSYGWAMFPLDNQNAERIGGIVVNPDSMSARGVVLHFYDGRLPDWPNAHNLALPLHSFVVATVAGITRGYMLASYLANLLFLSLLAWAGLNLADRFAIRRSVTLVTLLTLFSLPIVLDYVGQPLHYVVGTCASFLVVLSVAALDESDARNPWIAALAASILSLNYDPWVFLGALVVWILFVRRLARWWPGLVYLLAAAIPKIAWTQYLRVSSGNTMSNQIHTTFIEPVLEGWQEMITDPVANLLQPFIATHIGAHVAVHQILAMIYWPLVLTCVWLLFRNRPRISRPFVLPALLVVFFILEQMVAAGWDWELNPRRAIPVVLAFAVAWCWAVDQVWDLRRWRVGILALVVLSAFLAMADTLVRDPAMAFLRTGQAMKLQPHEALEKENLELIPWYMPKLMRDSNVVWRDLDSARIDRGTGRRTAFLVVQGVGLYLVVGLFWLAARARLLPRWAPLGVAAVWLVSLVRFL